jgi:hypothetical protein
MQYNNENDIPGLEEERGRVSVEKRDHKGGEERKGDDRRFVGD